MTLRVPSKKQQQLLSSPLPSSLAVRAVSNGIAVFDGDGTQIAGPFATNAEAWRWIDRHDAESFAHESRRQQIGAAIGQW